MRVSVIGLGTAGATLHLPALREIPGVRLHGVFDTDARRAASVGGRFGVRAHEGVEDLFSDGPEVVVIGTPPHTHAEYCLRALEAGAHVICEKPFVSSLEEADAVIRAADEAGRQVALNHQFREMPIFRALRDQVGRAEVGELVFAQVWQNMDLPPWAEPGWRGRMLQRTLFEAGVHLVDFLVALFGEQPVAVSASMSTCGVREDETDAVALTTLEFSRGRLAHVVQNRLSRGETQYFEVRAEGTEASLRASFGGRARVTAGLFRSTRPHLRFDFGASGIAWRERGTRRTFLARNPRNPGMVATRRMFELSLDAFARGTAPPVGGRDARRVLEVIAASYHAAATGARVRLDGPAGAALAGMQMGAAPVGV